MAMDGFTKDMNIIQKLNDEPNDRDGLTAGELKAKFDEGGLAVKEYLNNTVKPYVDGLEEDADAHAARTDNPHSVTKTQVGLGSVPNVSTNNQTPTYTAASSLTALVSGEKLGTAFGKLAKAVSDLISHIGNGAIHFTAAERTKLSGIETGAEVNSITGVKGNAESSYRTGNVNLTPANIGAAAASHTHGTGDITSGALPIARGGTGQGNALAAITALGGASIASQGIEIAENTDLNSLTTPGTYYSPSAAWSATLVNPPLTSAGFKLYVIRDYGSTGLLQIATTANTISHINQTYLRGGTTLQVARPWSDWCQVSFSGHTHAASDIDSGTLPITRGGTGQTTAKAAATSLLTSLGDGDTVMRDETLIATSKYDGTTDTWYKRPASLLWSYIKGKADALYAAVGHKHDDRYPTLLDGTVITSSADDPADLNDATYQVPGTYNCRRAVVAATVKHTPYYDTTTLVNADMLAFVLRVSYGVGTNQSISQELRTLNDGCVYYRYLQVSSGIWTAWDIVRGTASALNQHLAVSTTNAQDTLYFATTAASGETGTWYKRPASAIWNYIKGKAAAELYITAGKKSGTTLGSKATAEGFDTTVSGKYAHAEGNNTIAKHRAQHVFGEANVSDPSANLPTARGNYVEIVGNGDIITEDESHVSIERSNARTLSWNGNEWIAGTLTQASDARLKDIQGEVPDMSGIRAVRFKWNDRKGTHDEKDHIGYIAQDVEEIAPFLVGDDSNGYKSLDYIALLCAKVEMLERKVKALQEAAETEGGN